MGPYIGPVLTVVTVDMDLTAHIQVRRAGRRANPRQHRPTGVALVKDQQSGVDELRRRNPGTPRRGILDGPDPWSPSTVRHRDPVGVRGFLLLFPHGLRGGLIRGSGHGRWHLW